MVWIYPSTARSLLTRPTLVAQERALCPSKRRAIGWSFQASLLLLLAGGADPGADSPAAEGTHWGMGGARTNGLGQRQDQRASLIGDDPRRLEEKETVWPECGRVLVKDADRIWRQGRPRPLEHFIS